MKPCTYTRGKDIGIRLLYPGAACLRGRTLRKDVGADGQAWRGICGIDIHNDLASKDGSSYFLGRRIVRDRFRRLQWMIDSEGTFVGSEPFLRGAPRDSPTRSSRRAERDGQDWRGAALFDDDGNVRKSSLRAFRPRSTAHRLALFPVSSPTRPHFRLVQPAAGGKTSPCPHHAEKPASQAGRDVASTAFARDLRHDHSVSSAAFPMLIGYGVVLLNITSTNSSLRHQNIPCYGVNALVVERPGLARSIPSGGVLERERSVRPLRRREALSHSGDMLLVPHVA